LTAAAGSASIHAMPTRSTCRGQGCHGFTLIELMCTLAILLILFAVSFGIGGKDRQKERQQQCRENQRLVHLALTVAANELGGPFPTAKDAADSDAVFQALVPRYSSRVDVFRCPGRTRDPFTGGSATSRTFRNHYAYAAGITSTAGPGQWLLSDAQVDTRPKAVGAALFSETDQGPGSNHGAFGGIVTFVDGHATFSPAKAAFEIQVPPGAAVLNPVP
jgi:prepilin-type N-terminal cleavage/methylation domain-containing protein